MTKLVGTIMAGVAALVLTVVAAAAGAAGRVGCLPSSASASPDLPGVTRETGHAAGSSRTWDTDQVANARKIVDTGRGRGVPVQAQIIALATAMQEPTLRNLAGGDGDSVGLFQQRRSAGWGTPDQLKNAGYAADRFYDALLTVPGWQQLPLTRAAQAVQHSAYPDAYATWEPDAVQLWQRLTTAATQSSIVVSGVVPHSGPSSGPLASAIPQALGTPRTSSAAPCPAENGDGLPAPNAGGGRAVISPGDVALPVGTPTGIATALRWALAQVGTPYAFGGDCTDAHPGNPARECDCSSLVQQAFAAAGVTLPRTTSGLVHVGTAIEDLTALRPGDLLFIPGSDGTREAPGHVGLYLGGDLLVHAPHTGAAVSIAPLHAWIPTLSQVRRITATG